ncbi:MAG: GNAT family N-acetyltransferase [Candidatus Thorarchaeota archaeon]
MAGDIWTQASGRSHEDEDAAFFCIIFNGWLIESKVADDELYLDTIAVADDWRGKGIGKQIVETVFAIAQEKGLSRVKLAVVDTNPRAKAFYERIGFGVKKVGAIPYPWKRIFKFSSADIMEYDLRP